MASSKIRVFNGRFANVQGADAIQKLLAGIPDQVTARVQAAVTEAGAEFVEQARAIAPVAPAFEAHPGELRDSIHQESGGRALSTTIVVDARDEDGRFYPAHVEYGHTDARSGVHVAAEPFFWPTYRVTRKRLRSKASRAMTAAVKTAKAEAGA